MTTHHVCLILLGLMYCIESVIEYRKARVLCANMRGAQAIFYFMAGCSA